MAIEAVSNPGKAYQGSVPNTEAPAANTEKAATVTAEPVRGGKEVEKASVKNSDAEKGNDVANAAQGANPVKSVEMLLGTEAMRKAAEEINKNAKKKQTMTRGRDVIFTSH